MIFSLHHRSWTMTGKCVLHTGHVSSRKKEGECLADVPWKFFTGEETRQRAAS